MNTRKINALNKCIDAIAKGETIEQCIAEYPDYANDLFQLLDIAKAVNELRDDYLPNEAMNKNRTDLLAYAQSLRAERFDQKNHYINTAYKQLGMELKQYFYNIQSITGKLMIAILIAGIFIFLSSGLIITSAKSLPGDRLYPIKMAIEDIRVYFINDLEKKDAYEDIYTNQRVDEVKSLLSLERAQRVSFEAVLISKDGSFWNIGGIQVEIKPETLIIGGLGNPKGVEPGTVVEVEGQTLSTGWVSADEIQIRQYQFIGSVDKLSTSSWIISGIKVILTSQTRIETGIMLGDNVIVSIHNGDNGLFAVSIQRAIKAMITATNKPYSTELKEDDVEISTDQGEYSDNGILVSMDANYWIIGNSIYFITSQTKIGDFINIGDNILVKYVVERNGSYTALEIEKQDQEEADGSPRKTPRYTEDGTDHAADVEDQETSTIEPTEYGEYEGGEQTSEPTETPKPTETPEPTEIPHPTEIPDNH